MNLNLQKEPRLVAYFAKNGMELSMLSIMTSIEKMNAKRLH